jgi:hypothetical protein
LSLAIGKKSAVMTNDSKLGLFAGISVLLVVAVFFHPKSAVGPASISSQNSNVNLSQISVSQATDPKHDSLLGMPAKVSTPNSQASNNNPPVEKPADQPKPIGSNMADSGISTWKAETPRSQQPVSRDPLLWP